MIPVNARAITVKFARALSYLVYFWVLATLVILTLGFFLRLFGANPDAGFTEWVYRNLDRVMEPFRGIFPGQSLGDGAAVLDTSILFAMIVYGFVAIGFRALIDWLTVRMYRLNLELLASEDSDTEAGLPSYQPPVTGQATASDPIAGDAPSHASPSSGSSAVEDPFSGE